jgi:tetratricopeptide (TPR) repeat protein
MTLKKWLPPGYEDEMSLYGVIARIKSKQWNLALVDLEKIIKKLEATPEAISREEILDSRLNQRQQLNESSEINHFFEKSIGFISMLTEPAYQVVYLASLSFLYENTDQKKESEEALCYAIKLAETFDCEWERVSCFIKLSSWYEELEFQEDSLKYLDRAFELAKLLEDQDGRDLDLCKVAEAYGRLGRDDLAIEIASLVEEKYRAAIRVFMPLIWDCCREKQADRLIKLLKASKIVEGWWPLIDEAISNYGRDADGLYPLSYDYEAALRFIEAVKGRPHDEIGGLICLAGICSRRDKKVMALELMDRAYRVALKMKPEADKIAAKEWVFSEYKSMDF